MGFKKLVSSSSQYLGSWSVCVAVGVAVSSPYVQVATLGEYRSNVVRFLRTARTRPRDCI